MQCQACHEHTATIHLTEISSGERMETHLCESCAQSQGLAVKSQIPLNELLSTLLAVQSEPKGESGLLASLNDDTPCPSCGMTLKKFSKKTLLGCPNDYDVFSEQLKMLIEKSHGGKSKHCGKVPSRTPKAAKNQVELMNLQQQLDTAVKDEDYETAAQLRDRIKNLK